jgi:hypothetical protein
MENITKTVTLTITPDDIDTIVENLLEQNDIYNPWDSKFLRNLHEDLHVYYSDDYAIETFLSDPATSLKLIKAVAARLGERYKEAVDNAIAALL